MSELKQVIEKLDTIKEEIDYIKEHMIDADSVLTQEEEKTLDESLTEYKNRKTISLEKFEKERHVSN